MKKPACGKSNIRESCPVGHLRDVTFPWFSCLSDDSFIDLLKLAFHLCDPKLGILQGFLKAPSEIHLVELKNHKKRKRQENSDSGDNKGLSSAVWET